MQICGLGTVSSIRTPSLEITACKGISKSVLIHLSFGRKRNTTRDSSCLISLWLISASNKRKKKRMKTRLNLCHLDLYRAVIYQLRHKKELSKDGAARHSGIRFSCRLSIGCMSLALRVKKKGRCG